jgi:hypothetical protein
MEIDHIVQQADGGSDKLENAIPVCFECHAETHSYNSRHPRGKKFQPDELRRHRDQWLSICKDHPEIFRRSSGARAEVGPLQALIDELEFNDAVASIPAGPDNCLFKEDQFLEAIRAGSLSILEDELKLAIYDAYAQVGQVNQRLRVLSSQTSQSMMYEVAQYAPGQILKAQRAIQKAKGELLKFLSSET